MDIATLLKQTMEDLKAAKERFEGSKTGEAQRQAYSQFVAGVDVINKIYKGSDCSVAAKARIKEILAKALEEGKSLKDSLGGVSQIIPSRITPSRRPEDKDKEGIQNALAQAIIKEKPNVSWDDVAGLENAKQALQEAVILPGKFPEIFVGLRRPWRGMLLYGPPGTGKTFLAKACATQAKSTFFSVSSSDLISKFVGESEKLIKTLFSMARQQAPSIIFVDEIDSLVSSRSDNEHESSRRVKTEFLVQMQGVSNSNDSGILVIGATNLPWSLDSAMRRRFEKRIYISLPDAEARYSLLYTAMLKETHLLTPQNFEEVAAATDCFSGSDLNQLIKNACYEPLRKFQVATHFKIVSTTPDGRPCFMSCDPTDLDAQLIDRTSLKGDQVQKCPVQVDDFFSALKSTKPTVGLSELTRYENWTQEFGMDG